MSDYVVEGKTAKNCIAILEKIMSTLDKTKIKTLTIDYKQCGEYAGELVMPIIKIELFNEEDYVLITSLA